MIKHRQTFTIDDREIPFKEGETVMQAAIKANIYIPHLCFNPEFTPNGSCKLCTCEINGRKKSSCCTQAEQGMQVKNETHELLMMRRTLVQMLFVEGNHYCPFCERSGNCQLQALAYDLGVTDLHFPQFNAQRNVDASHPHLMLDHNRCIFCELCIRASTEVDKKDIFNIAGRSINKRLAVNSKSGYLKDTDMKVTDKSAHICPVGCIIIKGEGFKTPIGERIYDKHSIRDVGNIRPTSNIKEQSKAQAAEPQPKKKLKLATCSLAGCFGCHMSFLDIDERIIELLEQVELSRSPLNDIKSCAEDCDLGLIEGGVCNTENIEVLRHFRKNCKIIIAVGSCAINGGVPALRNGIDVKACLDEAYLNGIGLVNPKIPIDKEIPYLLEKVYPIHEVIKVDYFLPGCPPPADAFWKILSDLLNGKEPELPYDLLHFD
ncbi:MAG: coenzyme F420-reducing hydrogenase gamma subunit/ferredoxin [Psychromonas sp.]|jgi:coenzyme F420-reducing hydrogenase gamma subunit/ferredoxin|uniref:NADH-quinone oxidoreductase subunit B family protein n=1 Tax=Psychromonas sp. TaxID=1884585 RepID=UPI0039E424C7